MSERTASCLCGNLKAIARGEPEAVYLCSCLDCQRRSGSAFTYAAIYMESAVTTSGEWSTYHRTGDAGRYVDTYFCPVCGVSVFFHAEGLPGRVGITAGCFADPDFAQPTRLDWASRHHHWLDLPKMVAREDSQ
jgi:hypothetical protein